MPGLGKADVSTGRAHKATGNVEGGSLAGTIRSDQADDLTECDTELNVIERSKSVEVHGHVLKGNDR